MANWNQIISEFGKETVRQFATGNLSGRQFYEEGFWRSTTVDTRGEVRSLLRDNGVTEARALARKALRRRGVSV